MLIIQTRTDSLPVKEINIFVKHSHQTFKIKIIKKTFNGGVENVKYCQQTKNVKGLNNFSNILDCYYI